MQPVMQLNLNLKMYPINDDGVNQSILRTRNN